MKPRTLRIAGAAVTLAAVATIAITIPAMARKIRAHAESVPRERWAYQQVTDDEFTAFDLVGSVKGDADHAVVRWADDSLRIPIPGRDAPELPGMGRFSGWLAILAMISVEGDHQELAENLLATGASDVRLVLVTRAPAPGLAPETWGSATYNDWIYRYHELTRDGRIVPDTQTHTYTFRGQDRVEEGFRSYRSLKNDPYSWRFVAAMQVTPGLHTPSSRNASPISYPNYAGVRSALGAAGWTWPVAGAAFLALVVGLLMLGMSVARRRFED